VYLSSIRFLRQILLLSISLGQAVAMAQPAGESLAVLEKRMPTDTAAISLGLVLTRELLKTDPLAASRALVRIGEYAEQNRHYSALVTYAVQLMKLAGGTSDYKKAVAAIEELLRKYGDDLTKAQELELRIWLAEGLEMLYEGARAKAMVEELLPKVKLPAHQAQLYFIRANALKTEASYAPATEEYLKALKYYLAAGDLDRLVRIYMNLAVLKGNLEEYPEAIEFYQTAIRYARQAGDSSRLTQVYSNMGTVYRKTERYPQALEYYQKALKLNESQNNPLIRAQNLMNIGIVYNKTQRYPEALRYFDQSLELSRQYDLKYGIALSYVNRASVYTNLGQYPRAEKLLDTALVLTRQLRQPQEESQVYKSYSQLYEKSGKPAQALSYHKRYENLKDSLFSLEKQKQLSELMVKYEVEKKNAELSLQKLQLENDRIQIYSLMGLVAVLLVGSFGLWRYHTTRNRNLRMLYEKHTRLLDSRAPVVPKPARLPSLEDERLEALYERIVALFDQKKNFCDPRYSVLQLAQQLNTNERLVSSAIRLGSGLNFSGFVNTYRIHEATRLIRELGPSVSMDALMEQCGFKARSSFYSVFAAQTGLTPGQFIRESARDR
jgi:tetratricopeptide (TPR) repeat protein